MAKTTQYSEVRNVLIVIGFNEPVNIGETKKYQPVVINTRMDAITTEGAVRGVSGIVNIGEPVDVPLSGRQVYSALNKTQTGSILANALKETYLEAIDEDVTA